MKEFMGDNFLLNNETAIELYHQAAKKMGIIDYHCHLNPKEILENKRYKNITEMWLGGDHYKWRAMRSHGIKEEFITGNASDYEKFLSFAKTLENCIGNPLYHWAHLELRFYFGVTETLGEESAKRIWEQCNKKIEDGELDVRTVIEKSNVEYIGTTDDPIDDLIYHKKLKEESLSYKVAPSFRPDNILKIRKKGFKDYILKLSNVCSTNINSYDDLLLCIDERIEYFNEAGCGISDHGIEKVLFSNTSKEEAGKIFIKVLNGEEITEEAESKFFTYTMVYLAKAYDKYGWAMQLHMGPLRNNNERMFKKLGADCGFDSINDHNIAEPLAALLNEMDKLDSLPKTILYCLNPRDNEVLATMIGNFQTGGVAGKIQFGSGWWFNDQKDGMIRHLTAVSQLGLISQFIGMLTDSRSFLSFTRHEYFRRILCNFIGEIVENGEYPKNMNKLQEIVKNICYYNSIKYFEIETRSEKIDFIREESKGN